MTQHQKRIESGKFHDWWKMQMNRHPFNQFEKELLVKLRASALDAWMAAKEQESSKP